MSGDTTLEEINRVTPSIASPPKAVDAAKPGKPP